MCPVVSIHVVGVVEEMGNVGVVLLSKKPDAVIASVVAATGLADGQEEKKESEMQHTGFQQQDWLWQCQGEPVGNVSEKSKKDELYVLVDEKPT